MAVNIKEWLDSLGMGRYLESFTENEIDRNVLPTLTNEDLKDLGVKIVGHRRKILNALESLRETSGKPPFDHANQAATSHQVPSPERRQLTILFCDLVGSTELSQRLDPEELARIITTYHEACRRIVERWDGHVAKYLGDGVLAYFGYPQAHEDDAERAVRAGLELTNAVGQIDRGDGDPLAARVGIATGLVLVGELIGDGAAQEEAVVGETPNLASRLEALAVPGSVAISEQTRHLLGELFDVEDLGQHALKGFAKSVNVWGVRDVRIAASRFEARAGLKLTPLVGRAHELGMLTDLWKQAAQGDGQVALITGEAGIGKSRLAMALREQLDGLAVTHLRYQCSPFHGNVALHPVAEQLEHAAAFTHADNGGTKLDKLEALLSRSQADVSQVIPLIARLLGLPMDRYPTAEQNPQRQKERTFEVLIGQLKDLARQQPVLLLFEDLHWIDPTSLELLDRLVYQIEEMAVLAVFTFRPEFQPKWIGQSYVQLISLNRLSRNQRAAMVEGITQRKDLPSEVLNQIITKTDGVPLFVEELTKMVLESGLVVEKGDRFLLDSPLRRLAIPSSLRDSLLARLDRLAPVKEIAQLGAVVGYEFSHAMIVEISSLSGEQIDLALDRLLAAEIIFRHGTSSGTIFRFKHALLREVAYESVLKSQRQLLHGKIFVWLRAHSDDHSPSVLAHHAEQADLYQEAINFYRKAGDLANEQAALTEAAFHYRDAVRLINELEPDESRDHLELDVLLKLGPASMTGAGTVTQEIAKIYQRASELAGDIGSLEQRFIVSWSLCHIALFRGDYARTHELSEQLHLLAVKLDEPLYELQARHASWGSHLYAGNLAQAEQHLLLGTPVDHTELDSRPDLFSGHCAHMCCSMSLGLLSILQGRPTTGMKQLADAIRISRAIEHRPSLVVAIEFAAIGSALVRRPRLTRALAARALIMARDSEYRHLELPAMVLSEWARCFISDRPEAVQSISVVLNQVKAFERPFLLSDFYLYLLASLEVEFCSYDSAKSTIDVTRNLASERGQRLLSAELDRLEGVIHHAEGDHREAERCYRSAIEFSRNQGAKWFHLRATISLARLKRDQKNHVKAREILTPVFQCFEEGPDLADLNDAKSLLNQLS